MNILIITSRSTSANLQVAVETAKAYSENSHIWILCTGDYYSQVTDNSLNTTIIQEVQSKFIQRLEKARKSGSLIAKVLYRLFTYDLGPIIDTFKYTEIEKRIYIKAQELIETHDISTVISTNNPFYGHRVSNRLKSTYPQLFTIHLWLDPYLGRHQYKHVWNFFVGKLERTYFEKGDLVLSLPEVFLNDHVAQEYSSKVKLFEIPYIEDKSVVTSNKDIIFAGSFSGVRNPIPFLDFLSECINTIDKEVTFYFYCNKEQELKNYEVMSGGRIKICDYLSREELQKRLASCYMLLNIGNVANKQMPSKVVEYISYRKPIITYYTEENDPSRRYLDIYPDAFSIFAKCVGNDVQQSFASFVNDEHPPISYEMIMSQLLYRSSSKEYLRKIMNSQL